MKIRLKLTTPAGQTSVFEHKGPVVRIGRDPSCELLLEGDDAGKAASRMHARIELTPDAARLSDAGSANKTLHNTHPIEKPVPLTVGDRIQIGFTGATLVVQDLDLTPPTRGIDARVFLAVGGGAAACLVCMAVLLFWPRSAEKKPEQVQANSDSAIGPEPSNPPPPPPAPPQPPPPPPLPAIPPIAANKNSLLPSVEIKTVGHYLRSDRNRPNADRSRPSVLMQRVAENYPWTVLRSGQTISTGYSLLSLPGYESLIVLNSGLRLNLWGSVPEFAAPVFESAIMLNTPAEGFALDLTLDRGRVEIDSAGTMGRVRIRFLQEVWDVEMREPGGKVCVELWQTQAGSATGEAKRCFGLFSRGKVAVKIRQKERTFSSPARIAWSSSQPEQLFETALAAPPDWWDKPPARTPAAEDAVLSLDDWATKRLDQSTDVIDTILTVVRESKDRTDRLLGLWFLAALDEPGHLIEFLEDNDTKQADVRNTATYALRDWLARNNQRRETLTKLIQQRRGFSLVNAALVVSLLAPFSPQALADPAAYQTLIGYLDHDKLAVRHLAAQHLYVELGPRMPLEALKIDYDPTQEPSKRREAVAQWRKAVPSGKVPVRAGK